MSDTEPTTISSPFTAGQKLTIISISEGGHTVKRQIQVATVAEVTPRLHYQNGPVDGYRYGTYKEKGKRKEFYLDIQLDALVFDGWDIPILIDNEIPGYGGFHGNACLNLTLAGDFSLFDDSERLDLIGKGLRALIERKNLSPFFTERNKAAIIIPGATVHDDGTLLYPEIETSHGVIERMKERVA